MANRVTTYYQIVIFIFFALGSIASYAQESFRFERLTSQQGLSQNTVNCFLQDRSGMLWIGTMDGLNKYNGVEFEVYENDINNPFSLRSNAVTALLQDHKGTIWVGTRKGIHAFDQEKEHFTCYIDSSLNINYNRVIAIIEDKQEHLWVGYEGNGLGRLDLKTKQLKTYLNNPKQENSLPYNNIYALHFDSKNNLLWIGTDARALVCLDIAQDKFSTYPYPIQGEEEDALLTISESKDEKLWIGTYRGGLFLFDPQQKKYVPHNIDDTSFKGYAVSNLYDEKNGSLWIGTQGNGLFKYNLISNTWIRCYFDATDQESLSNNDVNAIFKDNANIFWIGTYNGGVNKYNPSKSQFLHYKKIANNPNSMSANGMRGIFEDSKGRLWAGTTLGGLNLINRAAAEQQFTFFSTSTVPPFPDDRLNMITEDTQGNIWVATLNKGLVKISVEENAKTKQISYKFETYQHEDGNTNSPNHNSIRSIYYEEKNNILWLGTLNGLTKFDIDKQYFESHNVNYKNKDSLSHAVIKYIVQDTDENILWIGTDGGLNRYDKKVKKFKRYEQDSKNPNSLSANVINSLLVDEKGTLWVGTVGGGLNRFDKETETFVAFTEKDGLPNNVIYGILEDDNGKLWLSTNKGISRFDKEKNEFYNYSADDGLQSDEFNIYAFGQSKKTGELFFGGINGFNVFHPDSIAPSKFEPQVVLTDFKVFNKSVKDYENSSLKKHITFAEALELSYENDVFSFDFASLDYKNPLKIKYQYKMENFNEEWIDTDAKRRTATYTNLPEGNYTFRVRATNSDGVWSKNEVALKIKITPPFWKTWIFRVLISAIFIGSLFFWYSQRIKGIEAQKEKLEKLVGLRTTEISRQNEEISLQKNELEKLYTDIKTLTIIGQEITSSLSLQEIIPTVHQHINQLMDASGFGLGILDKENRCIVFEGFMENDIALPKFAHSIDDPTRFSVWCLQNHKEIFINDIANEYARYVKNRAKPMMGKAAQSMIYLPLYAENQVVGVLTVQSFQQNAYLPQHLTLLKNLASYIGIAIDNANNYEQLAFAKRTIENKNRYTTDSIRYAKTIQDAILPDRSVMENAFGEGNYFVIYEAKDIVSGDFYWCRSFENKTYFAVIDCTGHGVPGALMSMIGNTLLTDIIAQNTHLSPAQILEQMHQNIRHTLKQKDNYNDDGMDIALLMLEKGSKSQRLTFAGAHLGLYYVSGTNLTMLRGNRHSVGGRQLHHNHYFTDEVIENLKAGDMIYLTTDGFTDQNDIHRVKYGSKKLKESLLAVANMSIPVQCDFLQQELQHQLIDTELRDDITLIGIRI